MALLLNAVQGARDSTSSTSKEIGERAESRNPLTEVPISTNTQQEVCGIMDQLGPQESFFVDALHTSFLENDSLNVSGIYKYICRSNTYSDFRINQPIVRIFLDNLIRDHGSKTPEISGLEQFVAKWEGEVESSYRGWQLSHQILVSVANYLGFDFAMPKEVQDQSTSILS